LIKLFSLSLTNIGNHLDPCNKLNFNGKYRSKTKTTFESYMISKFIMRPIKRLNYIQLWIMPCQDINFLYNTCYDLMLEFGKEMPFKCKHFKTETLGHSTSIVFPSKLRKYTKCQKTDLVMSKNLHIKMFNNNAWCLLIKKEHLTDNANISKRLLFVTFILWIWCLKRAHLAPSSKAFKSHHKWWHSSCGINKRALNVCPWRRSK